LLIDRQQQCSSKDATDTGYCGISLGGGMVNSLLLTAWPHGEDIYTSFRFASGYTMPDVYKGDAKLTQIASRVNSTHYTLVFRCQNCLKWDHQGQTGGPSTSTGFMLLGWVQAFAAPGNPTCPDQITINQHDNGMGIFPAVLDTKAANPSYTAWAAKATKTPTISCDGPIETPVVSQPVPSGLTFDYIIVGGGAGGIPLADKLSEAGKSVLLIEKGPPSTARWGGKLGPEWLSGKNLTRFDVPGLCNQIWVDSAGIACSDMDQMAGCVLGGGTAVNAGLWFKVSCRC
jgi:cellobiose dehydrogenase (acceptor)